MVSKRWVDIVAKVVGTHDPDELMIAEDVVKLLARQHAAVRDKVRMIRNRATLSQFQTIRETLVYRQACNDLLAALATHRKGRT